MTNVCREELLGQHVVRLSYLYDLTSLKLVVSKVRLVNHTPGSKTNNGINVWN